ncbi:MAG: tyrosine protein kinase [Flavobacteriaceae bacterium]|nr:tyrosine protein kinase [Flavobacteriaceae bacterium]
MMQPLPTQNQDDGQELTLREQLEQYLRYWPWFVLAVIVSIGIAMLYLRYTTEIYQAQAAILIKDEENSSLSELAAFQDLGLTGALSTSGFENEMEILRSKSLTERVVRELDLHIRYISEGSVKDAELYANLPFRVRVLTPIEQLARTIPALSITPVSETEYQLALGEDTNMVTHAFGEVVTLPFGDITVVPNADDLNGNAFGKTLQVLISNIDPVVDSYRNRINVAPVTKNASVIRLTLTSPVPAKAEAILNELIRQYNEDAIRDRNLVSRNTAEFIQTRLEIITEELDSVETGKVTFKESNRLTDIAAEGQLFLESASAIQERELELETQLELVATLMDYLQQTGAFSLLPTNLGIKEEGVSSLVNDYNRLVLERQRLLQSSTEQNPLVVNLSSQIAEMRATILENLRTVRTSLQISRNEFRVREARIGSEIAEIPSIEKQFRSISRQQEIKEALYLYLLQKREENAISLAVTTPRAKIVDPAYSSAQPVSPKKQIILLGALIVGLLVPFLVIYVRQLLNNKIQDRAYLERHLKGQSVVGEIPRTGRKDEELIQKNDRSIMAESFRILRTNLQYFFMNKKEDSNEGKVLFVTSTVKGEGKTFVASNLALTLAHSGSKVVLVGGDIRNPQLQRYVTGSFDNRGVVEYLVQPEHTVSQFLYPSQTSENLSILFSGAIPPNPAELWMQPRVATLFAELRAEFDYVVVDTAPAMLVTDTFLINKHADITLYTMRAGYTEKRLVGFPIDSIAEGKLQNVAFVLNDVSLSNFGYGNKYGYAYSEEHIPWWKRVFRRA